MSIQLNEQILESLDARAGARAKDGEVYMNCVFCNERKGSPDTKHKMGVNLITKIYHCHRCGAKPSVTGKMEDLKQFTSLFEAADEDRDVDKLKDKIKNLFGSKTKNMSPRLNLDKFSWKISKKKTPFAYKYITDRGFTDEEIERYDIRSGHDYRDYSEKYQKEINIGCWSGRVIFPFYEDGIPIYAVGRSYSGKEPRYINTLGNKSSVVYGIDRVKDVAIICEGIISAIAAERTTGVPAVSFLGKTASTFQLEKLRMKCHQVFLSLDGDVSDRETRLFAKELLRLGFHVQHISLPDSKDPDDLKEDYSEYFSKSKKILSF